MIRRAGTCVGLSPGRLGAGRERPDAAFTLIELLTAVVVVSLLVGVLMPELTAARRMTRDALCRHNLRQLGTAFATAAAGAAHRSTGHRPYPNPAKWPAVAYDAAPNERLFLCPEDDPGDWDALSALRYRAAWAGGHHWLEFADGCKSPKGLVSVRTRRGRDAGRGYTEFVFEENWNQLCRFGPTPTSPSNNDGIFRLSDPADDGSRTLELANYTCPIDNRAYRLGDPLFGVDDGLLTHVGQRVEIASFYTSYGINSALHDRQVSPNVIVLVSYSARDPGGSFLVDPDDAEAVRSGLAAGGRHRERVNVLFADQSVRSAWPEEMHPENCGHLWYTGGAEAGSD